MNLFKQFLDLLPPRPLEVGTVQSTHNGIATIPSPLSSGTLTIFSSTPGGSIPRPVSLSCV